MIFTELLIDSVKVLVTALHKTVRTYTPEVGNISENEAMQILGIKVANKQAAEAAFLKSYKPDLKFNSPYLLQKIENAYLKLKVINELTK